MADGFQHIPAYEAPPPTCPTCLVLAEKLLELENLLTTSARTGVRCAKRLTDLLAARDARKADEKARAALLRQRLAEMRRR